MNVFFIIITERQLARHFIQELNPSTPDRGKATWFQTLGHPGQDQTMSVILAPGVSTLIEKGLRMLSSSLRVMARVYCYLGFEHFTIIHNKTLTILASG